MASPPYSSLCGDRASPLGSLLSRGSHGLLKWPASMFNVSDIVSHVCCPVCCLLPLEEQITTRSFSYSPLLCGPLTGLAVLTVSFQTDAGLQSQVVMAWHIRLSHGNAFIFPIWGAVQALPAQVSCTLNYSPALPHRDPMRCFSMGAASVW